MPVNNVPTVGWTNPDSPVTVLLVTRRQREEMGARVALLRDERGWSNEALARASGLSVKTVSRFINATHEARMATIEALAKGLDVPETTIRGDGPAPFGPTASEDHLAAIETKFEGVVAEIYGRQSQLLAGVGRTLERLDEQDHARDTVSTEIRGLLERQSQVLGAIEGLLARQSEVLERIELLVETLPSDEATRELAAALAGEDLPAARARSARGAGDRATRGR